jgi:hypothetical protein
MEHVGKVPNAVYSTLHAPAYNGGGGYGSPYTINGDFAAAFHTYAADWDQTHMTFYVDGTAFFTVDKANLEATRGPWVYDHPFFIILNLAVGGNFPGSPSGSTPAVNRFLIDYVRVSTSGTTPPTGGTNALRGTGSGRCIDIPGANAADGARLQIWDCNGSGAQQWTIGSDGTIRALGKCMDAAAAGTANGTAIQLWTCNGSNAQRFTVSATGDIVNVGANKCVDVVGRATANGSQLQLWDCSGGSNQKWTRV